MKSYFLWLDDAGLHCDNPKGNPPDGEYVPADIAEALLAALEAMVDGFGGGCPEPPILRKARAAIYKAQVDD